MRRSRKSLAPRSNIVDCFNTPTGYTRKDPERGLTSKITQRDINQIDFATLNKAKEWQTIVYANDNSKNHFERSKSQKELFYQGDQVKAAGNAYRPPFHHGF